MTIASSQPPVREEAAAGIEKIEVDAVNKKAERSLYAGRQKIYARLARGRFRTIKWALLAITLGVYYLLPWLRWSRGPSLPDQAVLMDFAHGRICLFWQELWPQELYLVTGILIISALGLFLVTSIAGRVWCGYFCPQTVWTDLMIAVERFWQGDRNERIRLDKEAWSPAKILKKTMTHVTWIVIAVLTGGAFVFYFRDAPTLAHELLTGTAPAIAYIFLAIFAGTTYVLGAIAREQVCIYMCPWPRIQGAMFDRDSLLVTYRDFRGEPRGPVRKNQGWEGRGDCIDCKACVAVCPMGIDIRDGAQLECIQCALCIDACNEIMDKIGRPRDLIAYDTFRSLESEKKGGGLQLRLVRPRTLLYSALIGVVGLAMAAALYFKTVLEINVVPERTPLYVTLSDGSVRNAYEVKILNKLYDTRIFRIKTEGLQGARVTVLGMESQADPVIEVVPDNVREVRVFVTVPPAALAGLADETTRFSFVVQDLGDGRENRRSTLFRRPAR
jgi:cytochrome c oxidase accessory protein FixG